MRHQIKIATRILFSGTSEQSPEDFCFPGFFRTVLRLDSRLPTTSYGILISVLAWSDMNLMCLHAYSSGMRSWQLC